MRKLIITAKTQHLCSILNGNKAYEARKNKNLANAVKKIIAENGECRIKCACSNSKPYLNSLEYMGLKWFWLEDKDILGVTENSKKATNGFENGLYRRLNGYIVCEIVVDKVEHLEWACWSGGSAANPEIGYFLDDGSRLKKEFIAEKCSLSMDEFFDYFECGEGYLFHIKTVIPYEEPQENKRIIQNFAYVEEHKND